MYIKIKQVSNLYKKLWSGGSKYNLMNVIPGNRKYSILINNIQGNRKGSNLLYNIHGDVKHKIINIIPGESF